MRRRTLLGVLTLLLPMPAAAQTDDAESRFLAKLDAQGWLTGPRGVTRYRVLKSGPAAGLSPTLVDHATVHYQGRLADGAVFEDTRKMGKPAVLLLTRVIPAWKQIVPLMRPGDVWELGVPASAGYGFQGSPSGKVPPNANLFFTLELLAFTPPKRS